MLKMCIMPISKTQIDRLGDRLKSGPHTESDLRLLDEYRWSFGEAYKIVIQTIRQRGESPTGRLAKSTLSIVEKLRRESIRLSQMQDIAGCRVVVADVVQQEQFVASIKSDFPEASVIDRRDNPSYGYRAVHIIAEVFGKPTEIQVRSFLQHQWAELSEKSSDVIDSAIKYGGGPDKWRKLLASSSELVESYEECEKACFNGAAVYKVAVAFYEKLTKDALEQLERHLPEHEAQRIREELEDATRGLAYIEQMDQKMRGELAPMRNRTTEGLNKMISWLDERRLGGKKL